MFVTARTDDIINVIGHRLSNGAMEEVLSGHGDIAERGVIGVQDALKGQVPLGLVVLKAITSRPAETIQAELVRRVCDQIDPVASFRLTVVVNRLLKNRSGKILRATLRKMADGVPYDVPPTIEDASVLGEIGRELPTRVFSPDVRSEIHREHVHLMH